MQTFLPYPDFQQTAKVLDYRRLGKQRVEALQILQTLRGESRGWANHPAVKMWRGYDAALACYLDAICEEWIARGYRDSIRGRIPPPSCADMPPWLGDNEFHASHRSNLLRKDAAYYSKFGWKETNDMPYVWPCTYGSERDE